MTSEFEQGGFGCARCYGASAEDLWERWQDFRNIAYLIDGAHDIVRIVECPDCGQRYVQVTTEFVDWQDGEDPIYRSVVPVTGEESALLLSQGANVDFRLIESLGSSRRHLRTSWPKGQE
jgi:hypothetical protein